jgi:hypothetical protein
MKWTIPMTSRCVCWTGVWLSVEWLRMPQTYTQLNSMCLLFVNTGEWVNLNNVEGHFGISMVKEVYQQNPVFTNWWKKLETTGSVLTQHTGGRKMCDHTVQDVKVWLLASPRKSLRRLSQETGIPYSTCQRADKKAKLHPYYVSVVQELLPMDLQENVWCCLWSRLFGEHPGILDIIWFTDEALFHLSG